MFPNLDIHYCNVLDIFRDENCLSYGIFLTLQYERHDKIPTTAK